jgi:flavorubredoxin
MAKIEIKPGVNWVGGIDWDLRSFHGYSTRRGTTYNSYLIMDEKTVLVDTVKHYLFDEMLTRIKELTDPSKIDYIVSNHVEMDHSGSLTRMQALAPRAKILTSTMGEKGLLRHFKGLNLQTVKSGESLNIGKRTLTFHHIPMVHWPDSMVTHIPEQSLLLPNDAFGQHIASDDRFDDQIEWGILKEEAAKYYANIVMPYGDQVKTAMGALSGLRIDMIAPSHGMIWRSRIPDILREYSKWCAYETEKKALVVYDTMWHSTERIAHMLKEGLEQASIPVTMRNLSVTDNSDIVTDLLTSRLVLLGSPTLNNGMLPSMGAFLTYIRGLRPRRRIGFAFGSFGWGGQAVGEMEGVLKGMGWELPEKGINLKFIPEQDELAQVRLTGQRLGEYLRSSA